MTMLADTAESKLDFAELQKALAEAGELSGVNVSIQREDVFYAARTCLTLDMAYNNARLICRPETSWIKR